MLLLFNPVIIKFTFAVWKDIIFAIFVLLFNISFFRVINVIGNKKILDYFLMVIGAIGFCIFRNNGIVAFAGAALVILCLSFKFNYFKKLAIVFLSVVIVSFGLVNVISRVYSVKPTESVELLSIPLQQVSRTVVDNSKIDDEDLDKINSLIPSDKIKEVYNPHLSDPVKFYIMFNTEDTLDGNIFDYMGIYLKYLFKHPITYLKAWIDQTCGYFNGGYEYWLYPLSNDTFYNDIQITSVEGHSSFVTSYITFLEKCYDSVSILKLFTCTGV